MDELNTTATTKQDGDVSVIDVSFKRPGWIEITTINGPISLDIKTLFESVIQNTQDSDVETNTQLGQWASKLQDIALMLRNKEQLSARNRHEDWIKNSGHCNAEQQEALLAYKWKEGDKK